MIEGEQEELADIVSCPRCGSDNSLEYAIAEAMSEEFLIWLMRSQYRKVFEVCERTAKSADEISRLTNINQKDITEHLEFLERYNIIERTPEGWKITEMGMKMKRKMKRKELLGKFLYVTLGDELALDLAVVFDGVIDRLWGRKKSKDRKIAEVWKLQDQLEELKERLDRGAITEEEYEQEKGKLLEESEKKKAD